ncbi:MAG: insulinase family protein [Clostridia bacterium]|nr:insulinase family protein [Clostridia bacterium]
MKRILSLFLSLVMILGLMPCGLAESAAPTVPDVGEEVYGFQVVSKRDFPLVGAELTLFEHVKTGARLMYIANDDVNRAFELTFLTQALDNTGLPHVFEHATLDGSEKYPSKQLFFNLIYQTYNTYMNATTQSMMTSFPIASLSEEQLLRYADYYTDSCLHPMLMDDESIFREEAWRYRMESMEDDLTIEGTVYSEMLGATTLARAASMNNYRAAFPGSVIGNDPGGDPDYIPEMTYETLKSYHEKYYHPSNCVAYLYGAFEDYTAFLRLLDEAFAPYERQSFTFSDADYTPISSPVEVQIGFPVEAASSTDNTSVIYYSFVCPGLRADLEEEMVANTLTDLLYSDSSPLMQALHKAIPSGSFASFIDTTGPEDALVFYAANVNPEDTAVFRDTVDSAIAQIAQEGFSQELVDNVMASVELSALLIPENSDIGVDLINSLAYAYATSGDPYNYPDYVDSLGKMDDWNQEGRYKAAVQKWLTGSETRALVTTYPMPGEKENRDALLAQKLAEIKANMSEEEKQQIIDTTLAPQPEEDTSAMVASLQAVTVASLPEEARIYEIQDETLPDGTRRLNAVANVDGIGYACVLLDASGIAQEDIHFFKLLTDLVGELDTESHTKDELDVLVERYLYNGDIRQSVMKDPENGYTPYLHLSWIARDEDRAAGYELMNELLFSTQFSDSTKVLEKVQAAKATLRSQINNAGYNILLYRAAAVTDPRIAYVSYSNYLEYYDFLGAVESALQENPQPVLDSLLRVQSLLHNSQDAIVYFAGNEESIASNNDLAGAFLASLDKQDVERQTYDLPVPASREALILDTNVQFNSLMADYATLGMEYDAGLDAIMSLVSDNFLLPLLRDQYGVYTPLAGASVDLGVYLLTYRDPNITQTFAVYEGLSDMVASLEVDQDTLDGYILSSYSAYAKGSGELNGATAAISNILNSYAQEDVLEYMRQLKAVTPEKVRESAAMFAALAEKGVRATAGSASAIEANLDLYDAVLNPFNAVDTSSVTLEDVTEGSEHYEAVRFAFENALMAPLSETAFGVDEAATVGDIAGALYVAIGGTPNAPEEAVETFAAYGILSGDMAADTTLTNGLSDAIFVVFGQAIGLQLVADEPNETTDLPQTRGELAEGLMMLLGQ